MDRPIDPLVSVIIPVYNDEKRLRLCLAALAEQTYERYRFEIIVVDNGSDNFSKIKAISKLYENVVLTQEGTPGSYAARNCGIEIAQGDILAFTDADCIPAHDWLEAGVKQLSVTPKCGQVVGKIEMFFANSDHPSIVELYDSVTAFPQEKLLKQFKGGATGNMMTWRWAIDAVGHFNGHLKSHGDLEWGHRLYAQGYQQVYADTVRVRHPARASWRELYTRTRRLAGGYYDLQLEAARTSWQRQMVFFRVFLKYLVPPVFFAISTFLDSRIQGLGQKLKVSLVLVLVRLISAWETLKLKLGGVSTRV